mmetsp:Transcript_10769/g.23042  ORF Transcript_10769/g.23042 Transcript_10769/m.23042 type:complete len:1479 (+) Transcript_10769:104-4540(+)
MDDDGNDNIDDFYSITFSDDYKSNATYLSSLNESSGFNYGSNFDDDYYASHKTITGWFNNLLSNTTANLDPTGEGQLYPVEDVNPDNVLATLVFNGVVCALLLSLYEILRRYIPSVYSQRLVAGGHSYDFDAVGYVEGEEPDYESFLKEGHRRRESGALSPRSSKMASLSGMKASGSVCVDEKEGSQLKASTDNTKIETHNPRRLPDNHRNSPASEGNDIFHSTCQCCAVPEKLSLLSWVQPIHKTPWHTIRELAGLDAYFFLRYIRMCLKITSVSSFWAIIILCPVYAYGGGGQTGFYHFSMANVMPNDIWRVWVPTFFCWAFTCYCWFCVKEEMMHYMDLRMRFLGGEEEGTKRIEIDEQRASSSCVTSSESCLGSREGAYGAPSIIANCSKSDENEYGYATSSLEENLRRDNKVGAPDGSFVSSGNSLMCVSLSQDNLEKIKEERDKSENGSDCNASEETSRKGDNLGRTECNPASSGSILQCVSSSRDNLDNIEEEAASSSPTLDQKQPSEVTSVEKIKSIVSVRSDLDASMSEHYEEEANNGSTRNVLPSACTSASQYSEGSTLKSVASSDQLASHSYVNGRLDSEGQSIAVVPDDKPLKKSPASQRAKTKLSCIQLKQKSDSPQPSSSLHAVDTAFPHLEDAKLSDIPSLVDVLCDSRSIENENEQQNDPEIEVQCAPTLEQIASAVSISEGQYINISATFESQMDQSTSDSVDQHTKQHRYSLIVEKLPLELRSNSALFAYFNDMFPNQVHSASVVMNVPDLDALSARRLRVARRLEKSLAYWYATGNRPTHITGRGRLQLCGIESTPVDFKCVVCCCCYDSCRVANYMEEDGKDAQPAQFYEHLPGKGACVDSIAYYTRDLADCNLRMKKLQQEKFKIARRGFRKSSEGNGAQDDWYTRPLGWAKSGAHKAAEGLRVEFEVLSEDDVWEQSGLCDNDREFPFCTNRTGYGSFSTQPNHCWNESPLVEEDHLKEESLTSPNNISEGQLSHSRRRIRKSYMCLRAVLWRIGVDFLADGLDIFRNSTDVVVDSVTRPSMSSTGFITFKTLTPVTVLTSSPITYNGTPMEVSIAPESRDIVWQNIQVDRDIATSREFIANVLLGLGVLLWSIPLTLIQAWAKVEKVAMIPGFDWIDNIHGGSWKALINGYLPVIALLGIILLLPLIFQAIARFYEQRKTLSGVEDSIVGRYFYYQLANIYITVTAGALWTSAAEIIDHPQQLLFILGETLPKLAGYFISLLLTKTLAGLPMVLLRLGALSRMLFLRSCFNKQRLTQRELNEVYRKQPIMYGWEYPTQFLVIIICFTYACITPFILPVGAIFFFFALIVYKKQALYVYTPTYESGGILFPQAVRKTIFALIISQMTFIGYTLIRRGVYQLILLTPLPFLTIFFNIYLDNRFIKPSRKLSLERAIKIDALAEGHAEFSEEAYQQPVLTEKAMVPKPYRRKDKEIDPTLLKVLDDLRRFQGCGREIV